ncbi:hypothetical protein [Glaciecola sp. SC05]|uniref:hypothetical protein n=1 Tax=Glaciecola sp. SC05 TaxID=1987355 RepID=UPI003528E670
MLDCKYICDDHQQWIVCEPQQAFLRLLEMSSQAHKMALSEGLEAALPYIGSAFETAYVLYNCAQQSPQLTTMLTSLTITLANAYSALGKHQEATLLLNTIRNALLTNAQAESRELSKIKFLKNCGEMLVDAAHDVIMMSSIRAGLSSRLH